MEKKSILFVADKPNWAYHNIVKCWSGYLKDYDCYVAFADDYALKFHNSIPTLKRTALNTINPFRRPAKYHKISDTGNYSFPIYKAAPAYKAESMEACEKRDFDFRIEMAYYFQYTARLPFHAKKKLVGIYTDSFPHEGPHIDRLRSRDLHSLSREAFYHNYLAPYDGIVVGNTNLLSDYQKFTERIAFANGIYRQDEFVENPNVGKAETLTIGWTGNPERKMKGFREVIEPAVELIKKTGRKVELKTRFAGDYGGLLDFYKDADLVCIASEADTGPSLFAEASLANVPSISTRIGFPKMVIKDGENGIFVKRDIGEMASAIIRLYDDRTILQKFSRSIKDDYLEKLDNNISVENLSNFLNNLI